MKSIKITVAIVWIITAGVMAIPEEKLHSHRHEPSSMVMMPIPETDVTADITPTREEIDLIVRVTYAEAGNQPEEGIRAVVDVIRNRVNDPRFPNDIRGVLYATDQFSVVTFGTIWNVEVTQEKIDLVTDEWLTDTPVIGETYVYFNGAPIGNNVIQIYGHYFGE